MLTPVEQMLFIVLALLSVGAAYQGFNEMWLIINRGEGKLHLDKLFQRAWNALMIYITQRTTLKTRRLTSLFHVGVVWGFTFYFLVNFFDVLLGFFPDFEQTLHDTGALYELYRLAADVLSVVVLVGMMYFIIRRYYLPNRKELRFHENVLLHPKVKAGAVHRDSLIVAVFILFHVGSRFLGEAVHISQVGEADLWMPFASVVSVIFNGMNADGLELMRHLLFWFALGGIFIFLPYFPYTKHAHLFMAPLNYLTRPERTSLGEMQPLDFEDEDKEQFGANKLEDLPMTHIFDSFACIMCNRCQDVCPAYATGKELSPSAYEVNKRYLIKDQMFDLANGEVSINPLMGSAISESAVWACTACGACIDICPVGNEPMFDIMYLRRHQVLMEDNFPKELKSAFRGMERNGNPWNQSARDRMKWAAGLDVPTIDENPEPDLLWWVGCAPSYDPRAQQVAQAFAKILNAAGVNYAVLGESESCTGDSARRAGNEYLFYEMAKANIAVLDEIAPKRIVTTCP
ncbi:MAG: 4Fe-4S dicluster domain-containing protein, partial [Caldilineaceae bacterium]|nr:4Fe-4S dicluster domain-containing protein [Caldilineaceae bacterium]